MKQFLLFLSLICGLLSYSQAPDPRLFQTWYTSFVQDTDLSPSYIVAAIIPQITPTLIISEDMTFSGTGACNTFTGFFTSENPNGLQTTFTSQTLLICDDAIHNSFESAYFGALQSAVSYSFYEQPEGLVLTISTGLFGAAIFTNFPLKTTKFDSGQINIFPNPVTSKFFVSNKDLTISKIQVINSYGQNVKTIQSNFEGVDISGLTSGIYVLQIFSDSGIINKKIIKVD